MGKGYTEVLVHQTKRGRNATWTPHALDMSIDAFQLVVAKLVALESDGALRLLEKRLEAGKAGRRCALVRFKRL